MSHRGSVSSKVKHTHTGMTEEFQLKTTGVRRKSTNGDTAGFVTSGFERPFASRSERTKRDETWRRQQDGGN